MLKTGFKQLRTPLSKLEGRGLVERTGKDVYRKVPQSRKLAAPPPSPAPLIPMRLHPVSKRAISNYANVRQIVHGLLIEPHAFRDLIFATNGDVSEGTIRSVLNNGLLKGELSRADDGRYQLVTSALPQLSVAANSG
jgi:predicted transcriptional regulator of viral defense system